MPSVGLCNGANRPQIRSLLVNDPVNDVSQDIISLVRILGTCNHKYVFLLILVETLLATLVSKPQYFIYIYHVCLANPKML